MLVGRLAEQRILTEAYQGEESEFVAVYGRRRVGKTYLIRETFGDRIDFQHSGIANGTLREQLRAFGEALRLHSGRRCHNPADWFEAFEMLAQYLLSLPAARRKIVFLDELPWMDTPRSHFLNALEHFWNAWASARKDIVLLVCGSATSWMVGKLLKNYGGLHNRLTRRILLLPFTLRECEEFANGRKLDLSRGQLLDAYMVFGGVAYYWSLMERGLSVEQNVDQLLFQENGQLHWEFNALYASLFRHSEGHVRIVTALAGKKSGLTRMDLLEHLKCHNDTQLTTALNDLVACGFIRCYNSFSEKKREKLYQLIDNFTLFYFQFLQNLDSDSGQTWLNTINTPRHNTWRGLAFERICLLHIEQIKHALSISGIQSRIASWNCRPSEEIPQGAQVDLVIDRKDGVVNLCEMKYSAEPYAMTLQTLNEIKRKNAVFRQATHTRKALHSVLITANELVPNRYSAEIPIKLTADQLFA